MLALESKNTDKVLITNYKVMFATLNHQENLSLIPPLKFFFSGIANDYLSKSYEYYLLVRNPYGRLESFFKNKFRTAAEKKEFEHCQKIFFKYLEINKHSSHSEITEKLLSTSFEDFISMLRKVYKKDQHLHPQSLAIKFNFSRKDFVLKHKRINFKKIFRLECKNDISQMASIFDLDLSRKRNSTKSVRGKINWNSKNQRIVKSIYKEDFRRFKYSTDPDEKRKCNETDSSN